MPLLMEAARVWQEENWSLAWSYFVPRPQPHDKERPTSTRRGGCTAPPPAPEACHELYWQRPACDLSHAACLFGIRPAASKGNTYDIRSPPRRCAVPKDTNALSGRTRPERASLLNSSPTRLRGVPDDITITPEISRLPTLALCHLLPRLARFLRAIQAGRSEDFNHQSAL